MKKFGFTLAELLVAMGIIGVIAAITAPILDSIIPDKNKTKVLKAYKTISNINADLLSDPSLYMINDDNNLPCSGLDCNGAPTNPKYSGNNGQFARHPRTKYGFLVSEKMKLSSNVTAHPQAGVNFTTTDGINWTIISMNSNDHRITIDLDPDSNANCTFDTCANNAQPDRFEFVVLDNGTVRGRDRLTRAYLMNPTKLNDKKADLAKAKTLSQQ